MNEPEPVGLYLGKVTQYTDRGAIVIATEGITLGEGRVALDKSLEIAIGFDEGYQFGIGTYIPRWLDEHLKNGSEMPGSQDLLAMDTWKAYLPSGKRLFVATHWGYFDQFQEVVNQMAKLPLYQLSVSNKGEFTPIFSARDLDFMREEVHKAVAEIHPQIYPLPPSIFFQLRRNKGKHWELVSRKEMKSLLRID